MKLCRGDGIMVGNGWSPMLEKRPVLSAERSLCRAGTEV